MRHPVHTVSLAGSAALVALLLGCSGCARESGPTWHGQAQEGKAAGAASLPVITLDGETSDWPEGIVATADEHHLYLRFTFEGSQQFTLQAADESTVLLLDTDANASTGERLAPSELSELGIDLEVVFSPPRADGSLGRGVALRSVSTDGIRKTLSVYDWDFAAAPTFASDWYEARLSRTPAGDVPEATKGLLGAGTSVRGAFGLTNGQGALLAWSAPFVASMPERCQTSARASNVSIPKKPAGGVRVLSYNVLRGSPKQRPEVYARILKAIDADVLLVQEWESGGATELQQWFATNAGTLGNWQARAVAGEVGQGGGVAVISRLPITGPLLSGPVEVEGRPMRFIGAEIDSPVGPLHVASTHLKCCGTLGSREDQQRMNEANAINSAVAAATLRLSKPDATVIIAGDMNLVGGKAPLDALVKGLDVDGSSLRIAPTKTLGDRTFTTWSEVGNNFGPGRLDYIVYSDGGSVRSTSSFVLDTSRLSDATLASMGLQRSDTADASDHKPVVVDFVR
jgi:endonuclease/exonuclease/phosphatase family metal-dependent hydrolase